MYKVLVGKTEGKKPLWRPRHRWEVSDWINLAQYRGKVGFCENCNESLGSIKLELLGNLRNY